MERVCGFVAAWKRAGPSGQNPSRELFCLERAVDLEQAAGTRTPTGIARDEAALLAGYRAQADAATQLGQPPPAGLKEKVVRAADRWRAVDSASNDPFNAAGEALRRLGDADLAWSYFTTPLSQEAAEARPWEDLAKTLQSEGDVELASRAFAAACDADPADAQALFGRAAFLEMSGHPAEARAIFGRIAHGSWDEKYSSLKTSARERLR